MKITLSMTVDDLLERFKREFGVALGIYRGAKNTGSIKLLEIADRRHSKSATSITVNKDTRVGSVEAMFTEHFGIRVQVKDLEGNTVSQDLTLGGVRDLAKGITEPSNYDLGIKDDVMGGTQSAYANVDDAPPTITKPKKKSNKKFYISKPKPPPTMEQRLSYVDKCYLRYQKTEGFSAMTMLLSAIEEASIAYPNEEFVKFHTKEIRGKASVISSLSIKKRKFFLLIITIIVAILLLSGVGISMLNLYRRTQANRTLDSRVGELDSLRSRRSGLLQEGRIADVSGVDSSIDSTTKEIESLQLTLQENRVNYFLILSLLGGVAIAAFIVNLNKYTLTSSRFDKEEDNAL